MYHLAKWRGKTYLEFCREWNGSFKPLEREVAHNATEPVNDGLMGDFKANKPYSRHLWFYKQRKCTICNTDFRCSPSDIRLRNRKTCSVNCGFISSSNLYKERRIKNGFTKHQIDRCLRSSKECEDWRKAIFERDNYTCQFCGIRNHKGLGQSVKLEADHIKPFAYFPKLRFVLDNGRTLCRPCHDKTKMYYGEMRKLYAKN